MRIPRWLLVLLWISIGLAVVSTAGWLWAAWPERTARKYATPWNRNLRVSYKETRNELEAQPRTWLDVFNGRQRFIVWRLVVVETQFGAAREIGLLEPTDDYLIGE